MTLSSGEGGKVLRDDEPNFMDSSSVKVVVTEENILVERN